MTPIHAEQMYVDWNGLYETERCRVCLRALAATPHTTPQEGDR